MTCCGDMKLSQGGAGLNPGPRLSPYHKLRIRHDGGVALDKLRPHLRTSHVTPE